jgi:hypothetical protein
MPDTISKSKVSTPWSDEELSAAVAAYREMMRREKAGLPVSKKAVYRSLASEYGRTEKAFEYRMQNISAVLAEYGEPWIKGLVPATNVGEGVKERLFSLLAVQPDESPANPGPKAAPAPSAPEEYKRKLPAMRDWLIGIARKKTVATYGDAVRTFELPNYTLRHALIPLGRESLQRKEPIITALVVNEITGHCSEGLEKEFGISDDAAERVRLYKFWSSPKTQVPSTPPKSPLEQRAAKFSQIELRPGQAAFRKAVFLACSGRCVISGCDIPKALDAAHRVGRDWRLGHNSSDDGYLLRKDLHALYDAGLLTITADDTVQLDSTIVVHYQQFVGIKVNRSAS